MKKLIALLVTMAVTVSPAPAENTASTEPRTTSKSGDFFKKMDANGDGTVSLEEFKAGLSAQKDSVAVEEYFSKLDSDADGRLTLDEYTRHMKPAATPPHHEEAPASVPAQQKSSPGGETPHTAVPPGKTEANPQQPASTVPTTKPQPSGAEAYFKKMDSNNDGVISLLEFKASSMGQNNPRMAEEYFKKLDTNNDGKVTLAEFTAHRSQASSSYRKSHQQNSSSSLVSPHLGDGNSKENRKRK